MFATFTLSALSLLANMALAAPTELEARSSQEVVYLCNCFPGTPEATGGIAGDYYTNIANSHNGERPGSESTWLKNAYPRNDLPTWEGTARALKFSDSGVTFTSHINGNGGSLAVGAYAGYGYNGHNFNCYKDNGKTLYEESDGFGHTTECRKEYYCRPT